MSAPLLKTIDANLESGAATDPRLFEPYDDLFARPGGDRWGAFEPIVIRNPGERRDTGWVIVAQEELP
ncbi:MAG: hypothetical protein ACRCT8_11645 [Lacipirellulaceae bacterium]